VFGLTPSAPFDPVTLSINGAPLFNDPNAPPVGTYSAAIHLEAGQSYRLAISGTSHSLTWATPTVLNREISAAATAAAHAKTAVVVVADDEEAESGDRATLTLPSAQDALVRAVVAANPRTVVVVSAGGAVLMPWLSKVAAVVDQWYAGQAEGTALTAILFGAVNPSGHLPVTFPSSLTAVPASTPRQFPGRHGRVDYSEGVNIGYRWWVDHHRKPLFPFGFGLSYTSFRYAKPVVRVSEAGRKPVVSVRELVTNTGSRGGADVAQLYLGFPPTAAEPARQLEAFQRVNIPAGKAVLVGFELRGLQLAYFHHGHWQIPAGTYRIDVGDSSAAPQLGAPVTFTLRHPARP